MLKPDRFSCSQKMWLKRDPPVPPIQTQKEQATTENKKEDESCILEQLDLGEISTWSVEQQQAARKLLYDYSETFSNNDLDLGKCNILKT